MKLWTVILALVLTMGTLDAHAKRLGGGKSVGKQSSNVTQREAAPATPAPPAQNAAPAKPTAPAAAPAPAPAKKPWGAMLGGLAAGLGLAWLAHSLGLGEAFGQILLIALFALAALFLVRWLMRSRQAAPQQRGLAMQGAGAEPAAVATTRTYSPDHVGNDASARPWERPQTPPQQTANTPAPASGVRIGAALQGKPQPWGIPADFDVDGFVQSAKRCFISLQDAWDRSDMAMLKSMMTDEMAAEIRDQLAQRHAQFPGRPNKTEVLTLQAQLLGIEEIEGYYLASVEFSGVIREDDSAGPGPLREVWNMSKPVDGSSGWLVAGVQALQ